MEFLILRLATDEPENPGIDLHTAVLNFSTCTSLYLVLVQRLGGSPALRLLVRLKRRALTALAPPRPSRTVAKIAFLIRAQADDHQPAYINARAGLAVY